MAGRALVTNHPINALVRQIQLFETRDDFLETKAVLSDVQKAGFERVFFFTRQLAEQLERTDDVEVSLTGLTTVQSHLQNVQNELASFLANNNTGHVDNAIANLDGAINSSSWVFFRRPARGSHLYGESIASVEAAALQAIESISARRSDLEQSLDDLSTSLITMDEKATIIASSLESVAEEHTTAVAELNAAYETFEQAANERTGRALSDLASNFESVISEKAKEADSYIQRISQLEAQAKKIVQIVGNIGVTGNYQNRAMSEQRQANVWRWVTVFLLALGVGLVAANLLMNLTTAIDLKTLVIRFAIAVAITIPAIYTARESARHRTNSDKAKQTELELASLSPFLENLPEDQKDLIVAELAKSYFGQRVDDHKVENPVDINKLMDSFVSIAAKIKAPA